MSKTMRVALGVALVAASSLVHADGWSLRNGRFPAGNTLPLDLSPGQTAFLDFAAACRGPNTRTPYVFHLNKQQAAAVLAKTGKRATRFAVFDSTRGERDVDLEWNAAIRYAQRKVEIPLALVDSDRGLRRWERGIIGWAPNPIETASPKQIKRHICPG